MENFNPRPREEGDFGVTVTPERFGGISIHALVKRATVSLCWYSGEREYFNPRPREEGDLAAAARPLFNDEISIHALVKRAT